MNEEQVKLLAQLKARKSAMRTSSGLVLDMNTMYTIEAGSNRESSVKAQDGLTAAVWEVGKGSDAYDKLEAMMDKHIEAAEKGDFSLQHQEWVGDYLKVQERDIDEDGKEITVEKYVLGIGSSNRMGTASRRRQYEASLQG